MRADLLGSLQAIALFPLFVLVPGYAAAWALQLFDFRSRSTAFRLALSIPLSIALCPILTYLTARFLSMQAVWVIYGVAAFYFIATLRRGRFSGLKEFRPIAIAAAVWLAVALFSLIDIQTGDRLYLPTSAIDHSLRSAFIHSIS